MSNAELLSGVWDGVKKGNWSKEIFPSQEMCRCERGYRFIVRGNILGLCNTCLAEGAESMYQADLMRIEKISNHRAEAKRQAEMSSQGKHESGMSWDNK